MICRLHLALLVLLISLVGCMREEAGSPDYVEAICQGDQRVRPLIVNGTGRPTLVNMSESQVMAIGHIDITHTQAVDPKNNKTFVCSGTLITPKWVLTAEHCTDRRRVEQRSPMSFSTGSSTLNSSDWHSRRYADYPAP